MTPTPNTAPNRRPGAIPLFAEDFDHPPGVIVLDDPDEAEPAAADPPAITAEMLTAARSEAFAEGVRYGHAQAAADREQAVQGMLAALPEQLREATASFQAHVDSTAEHVTRLVFAILDSVFPSLCRRFGGAELARFTQKVVAVLSREPRITIRVHPQMQDDIAAVLDRLEPDLRERIVVDLRESVPPGDGKVLWQDATASRDAQRMWTHVHDALSQLGLTEPTPTATPAATPDLRVATAA